MQDAPLRERISYPDHDPRTVYLADGSEAVLSTRVPTPEQALIAAEQAAADAEGEEWSLLAPPAGLDALTPGTDGLPRLLGEFAAICPDDAQLLAEYHLHSRSQKDLGRSSDRSQPAISQRLATARRRFRFWWERELACPGMTRDRIARALADLALDREGLAADVWERASIAGAVEKRKPPLVAALRERESHDREATSSHQAGATAYEELAVSASNARKWIGRRLKTGNRCGPEGHRVDRHPLEGPRAFPAP